MIQLNAVQVQKMIASPEFLNISIYLPMSSKQGRNRRALLISRMHSLLNEAIRRLTATQKVNFYLESLRSWIDTGEWIQETGSVCVLIQNNMRGFLHLPDSFPELSVVSDSLHIKPLISHILTDFEYGVCVQDDQGLKLYKHTPRGTQLIDRSNSKEPYRFAQSIIVSNFTRLTPIFIISDRSFFSGLREKLPGNRLIRMHPSSILNKNFNQWIADLSHEWSERLIVESVVSYRLARDKGMTEAQFSELCKHALDGTIRTLFVNEDRHIWGVLDRKTGQYRIHRRSDQSQNDDLLDDLAELVLSRGGKVVTLPQGLMPETSPACAIIGSFVDRNMNSYLFAS